MSADEANAMFARLASGGVARDRPDDTSPSTSSSSPVDRGVDACASPTDEVNPTNMMPTPDQRKSGGQRNNLSTHRVASTIPISERNRSMPQHQKDAAATGTWQYPSEQMFFNAIKRKGWTPKEEDMTNVIAIHNAVNERCWAEVLRWESLHAKECDCPKLLKFRGRPRDYSPKARFLNFLGFKLPFDRHDWVVDRCGTDVRYVIDFYNAKSADPRSPDCHAPRHETGAGLGLVGDGPAVRAGGVDVVRGVARHRKRWGRREVVTDVEEKYNWIHTTRGESTEPSRKNQEHLYTV